jgi:hypothetical protein
MMHDIKPQQRVPLWGIQVVLRYLDWIYFPGPYHPT